ncbi:hypothetical protein [Peribacillus sp. SCS-37]|uniref:hypothetical protein n=1 Tax=Paraperibacillus esterisolvens TaxID=3115296 RepID=UPI003905AD11
MTLTGTINFSSEECFTGAAKCNPKVDNFNVKFTDNTQPPKAKTLNLTEGRRGMISCTDGTAATLLGGTAQGAGNSIPHEQFIVDFTYIITGPNTANLTITATGEDGTIVTYTVTGAPISSRTFIGDCSQTVSGG